MTITPLQEVASRIYAAKIASGILTTSIRSQGLETNDREFAYNYNLLIAECITEAKALLEACKPKPLEWIQEENDNKSYSKGYEFEINWIGVHNSLYSGIKFENFHGNFDTLDDAKAFAEHIRTR